VAGGVAGSFTAEQVGNGSAGGKRDGLPNGQVYENIMATKEGQAMTAAGTEAGGMTGGCRCGAITYTATGAPAHHAVCHCTECRRSSGSFAVGWALFPRDSVAIEGQPVAYESSPGTIRQFCGTCGTGLFYVNEAIFPGQIDI
jgi:hypothetical protein